MRPSRFDASRLDVEALAIEGARLAGEWPAAEFSRLLDSAHAACDPAALPPVRWEATGEYRTPRAGEAQVWLRLKVHANVPLVCQRCLGPLDSAIDVDTAIRFVRGEDAAADLDAASEFDVLALTNSLDLEALAEDELLLALPLVPRHEPCTAGEAGVALARESEGDPGGHPFAPLAALKRDSPVRH